MRTRSPGGFTLIEVMVALVIMSVMALMAWRGVDAIIRSRDISLSHLEQTARMQTVLAQWDRDLQELQDSQMVPALSFDGATLRLTRRHAQGLQVVAWTLRDGALYRWASVPATSTDTLRNAFERSQQALSLEARNQLRALEGVSAWQLYFYRGNSWSNAQSSGDEANDGGTPALPNANPSKPDASNPAGNTPGTPNNANGSGAPNVPPQKRLPTGVRMVLQFAPGQGLAGSLTRQIALGPQS